MAESEKASKMSDAELTAELKRVSDEWDDFRRDLEGMSGSPGEWLIERMDELQTEQRRRALAKGQRQ